VVAGAALVTVSVAAATLLVLWDNGSDTHASTPTTSSAATRHTGASKVPADTTSGARPGASASTGEETHLPDSLVVKTRRLLNAGEFLQTVRTKLIMQQDGNLVVYDENGTARWASGTFGTGLWAVFQETGNIVIYDRESKPVWTSGEPDHQSAVLWLQEDGNVVIQEGSEVLWQSGTAH
jgi:hypothetical protein